MLCGIRRWNASWSYSLDFVSTRFDDSSGGMHNEESVYKINDEGSGAFDVRMRVGGFSSIRTCAGFGRLLRMHVWWCGLLGWSMSQWLHVPVRAASKLRLRVDRRQPLQSTNGLNRSAINSTEGVRRISADLSGRFLSIWVLELRRS